MTAPTMLNISDAVQLPLDAVTETLLILGKRGTGKTNTGVVMAEEMILAGQTVGIIDPTGAWWGLRSSADGTGPGLPVIILGGEHGDLPLDSAAGKAAADLLLEERLPLVLDLSIMSKTQQRRFVTDFLERLYHKNRDPLHLIIDEADLFAPQRATHEIARLLGAYEDVVRRGRIRGIGSTSITQRPAGMHTDIRSQPECLICLRLIGKHDIVAIDEWVRLHATDEDARELKASLPSLPVGTAWFWSPGWLELIAKVQIRARRTFDSSATPKVGQTRIVPREFAQVATADLERLSARLGHPAAPETALLDARQAGKATAAELAQLRAQVAELQQQLAEARARPVERVQVSVLPLELVDELRKVTTAMHDTASTISDALLQTPIETVLEVAAAPAPAQQSVNLSPSRRRPRPAAPPPPPLEQPAFYEEPSDDEIRLKLGARNMLTVLARQHPQKLSRAQMATLAKLKVTGGTFTTYFSAIKRAGLIVEQDGFVLLTEAGFAYTGSSPAVPINADELRETWRGVLKAGARNMLDVLLGVYPTPVSRENLADTVGLEVRGGTFTTYLSTLRRNGLVDETSDGIRAAEVFFLGGQS